MAGAIPVPVSPEECERCKASPEPTLRSPNVVTAAALSRFKAGKRSTARARGAFSTPAVANLPAPDQPAYTEADFPCPHRGPQSVDAEGNPASFQCTPCDGGRLHVLYDCAKHGRECTVFASRAKGKDGAQVLQCIACDDLPSRIVEEPVNPLHGVGSVIGIGGLPPEDGGLLAGGGERPVPVTAENGLPVTLSESVPDAAGVRLPRDGGIPDSGSEHSPHTERDGEQ